MTIDNVLGDAMRALESDSPAEIAVAATVRGRINRRHKVRSTALATAAAVAAVAAIVTTASVLRSPAPSDEIRVVSPPQIQASTPPASVSSSPVPASSGAAATSPTTTADPAVTGFSARCYTTADIGRTDNHLAISLDIPMGPYAVELCQQNWAEGTLSSTAPFIRDQPLGPGQPVPNLVACVLPADMSDEGTDEVAVFPGTAETCNQLGLPPYTG